MKPRRSSCSNNTIRFFSVILISAMFLNIGFSAISTLAQTPTSTQQYTISFSEPVLSETKIANQVFTQITIDDCITHGQTGTPALPMKTIHVLIPYHTKVEHVDATPLSSKSLPLNVMDKPIMPQQDLQPLSFTIERPKLQMLSEVYNSKQPVNPQLITTHHLTYCRGFPILTLQVHPVQYTPGLGTLEYYPKIQITVHTTHQTNYAANSPLLRMNPADMSLVENLVINPETLSTYDTQDYRFLSSNGLCNPAENYRYVVITDETLNNATGELYNWSDLLVHRAQHNNLSTTLVTVEEINCCQSYWNDTELYNDTAAHIRGFIRDAYLNWGTEYVVLGGDSDVVAARMFYVTDADGYAYPDMPCDLYYSNLDGTWRDTTNDVWGGGKNSDANDYHAEVFVGRMTVSTAAELSNFIEKIIWYDTQASDEFLNKAVFFGGNLGWSVTSADYMEEIRTGEDPHFYTCTGFTEYNTLHSAYQFNVSQCVYYDQGGNIPTDYKTIINNNNACLINHLSHGSPTTALDMPLYQLASLTNTNYFFSYSGQCLSGRFTSGDTAEKKITAQSNGHGAFAVIWNTGYGWADTVNTNGPNQYLQRHFWDYLFTHDTTDWALGNAHYYAKDCIADYADSGVHFAWCYNWYSTHLFGDPAQLLRVAASDEAIVIDNELPLDETRNLSSGIVDLSVNVSDPENDLMDIHLYTNNSGTWSLIGENLSVSNGRITQRVFVSSDNPVFWWKVTAYDKQGSSGWTNATYHFSLLLYNETPSNQATNVSISLRNITIQVYTDNTSRFNWTISTTPHIGNCTVINQTALHISCPLANLTYATTYNWSLNISHYNHRSWTNHTYSFTTENAPVNYPPLCRNNSPHNQTTLVSIGTTALQIYIIDGENDAFNWSIETSPDIGSSHHNDSTNGLKICNITDLDYETTYTWYVNITDTTTGLQSNYSYWFTTEEAPAPKPDPQPKPRHTYTPTIPSNTAPQIPQIVDGTETGYIDTSYTIIVTTTDSDEDDVQYLVNWDDESNTLWTELTPSGTNTSVAHTWNATGVYNVTVKAKDEHSTESSWSDPFTVTIKKSQVPQIPTESHQKPSVDINQTSNDTFCQFNALNLTGNMTENVTYIWDFGDGTLGTGIQPDHQYDTSGLYHVTLKTVNLNGDVIDEVTFTVTINPTSSPATYDPLTSSSPKEHDIFTAPLFYVCIVLGILCFTYGGLWIRRWNT